VKAEHKCTDSCHLYGFHGVRYANARYNYQHPDIQNQMGHVCAAQTEHYRKWAKWQLAEYDAYVPNLEEAPRSTGRHRNPRLRVVG